MQIKTTLRYYFYHLPVWQKSKTWTTYCIDEAMGKGVLSDVAGGNMKKEQSYIGELGNSKITYTYIL